MDIISPHLPELMRDRNNALLREAVAERQIYALRALQPGLWAPLLHGLGDGLVAAGEWLRRRTAHTPPPWRIEAALTTQNFKYTV